MVLRCLHQLLYEIQDLISKKTLKVHAAYLNWYADKNLNLSAKMLKQIAHDNDGFVIDKIEKHFKEGRTYFVEVSWIGFDPTQNTEYPIHRFNKESPSTVRKYIRSLKDKNEKNTLLQELTRTSGRKTKK